MENNYISFKRERDFGEVFNATFYFIKQEYKRLGMAILYFVLPFAILTSVSIILYQTKVTGITPGNRSPEEALNLLKVVYWNLAKVMFAYSFSQAAILSTTYGYIRLYVQKGPEGFTATDVWSEFKKLFIPFYFSMLLIGLMIIIGAVFCFLPGIYLAVSLCLIFAAMAFEQEGFGSAFSRTFQLTHLQWWWTLLVLFVLYIIVALFNILLSLPALAYNFTTAFHAASSQEGLAGYRIHPLVLVYSSVITAITMVLYFIPQVALAFQYFSLVERKEKPSLLDKINNIGKESSI